jgi:hypothetical protein
LPNLTLFLAWLISMSDVQCSRLVLHWSEYNPLLVHYSKQNGSMNNTLKCENFGCMFFYSNARVQSLVQIKNIDALWKRYILSTKENTFGAQLILALKVLGPNSVQYIKCALFEIIVDSLIFLSMSMLNQLCTGENISSWQILYTGKYLPPLYFRLLCPHC